jgi:nucleotide-binding universal stress UspA family protein
VDFSDASRGALRYAAALAEHFYAVLAVLTVNDPAVNDVALFVDATFGGHRPSVPELRLETANGLPAVEILRVANETQADVIVMSTHGAHRRPTMLGSVTERLLRETKTPVVLTPAEDPGPHDLEQTVQSLERVLVPVDFSACTDRQITLATGIGQALDAELLFLHVLDDGSADRRLAAHGKLDALIRRIPARLRPSLMLAVGDPATEIARVARERRADLILMGLHSSDDPKKGMGHVTYGVLCATPTLVLAFPPLTPRKPTRITAPAAVLST